MRTQDGRCAGPEIQPVAAGRFEDCVHAGRRGLASFPASNISRPDNVVAALVHPGRIDEAQAEIATPLSHQPTHRCGGRMGRQGSVAKFESGLAVTLRLRKEGEDHWLALEATGDGEARKSADELAAKAQGWEFKVPAAKAQAILKRRTDLFEGS